MDDHTVQIDNFFIYAQGVTLEEPFVHREWVEVKIENGAPRRYPKGFILRKMSFTGKMYGDIVANRRKIEAINDKIVHFVSVYIGAFPALVTPKISYEDGAPDFLVVEFTVEEVVV